MTGKIAVGGITRTDGLVLVRVHGAPAGRPFVGRVMSELGRAGINIVCVASFTDACRRANLCLAIAGSDLDQALGLLQDIRDEVGAERIETQRGCSAVSVYGPQFSSSPSIGGRLFEATAAAGVDVHMISTSFTTIAFLVDSAQADGAVAQLRETFLVP
jgi:aspartate kinase